jgi:hypothetical protein
VPADEGASVPETPAKTSTEGTHLLDENARLLGQKRGQKDEQNVAPFKFQLTVC